MGVNPCMRRAGWLAKCLDSILNVKLVVATFNQERAEGPSRPSFEAVFIWTIICPLSPACPQPGPRVTAVSTGTLNLKVRATGGGTELE